MNGRTGGVQLLVRVHCLLALQVASCVTHLVRGEREAPRGMVDLEERRLHRRRGVSRVERLELEGGFVRDRRWRVQPRRECRLEGVGVGHDDGLRARRVDLGRTAEQGLDHARRLAGACPDGVAGGHQRVGGVDEGELGMTRG